MVLWRLALLSVSSCIIGHDLDARASHAYADDVAMSPYLSQHGTSRISLCGSTTFAPSSQHSIEAVSFDYGHDIAIAGAAPRSVYGALSL